MSKYVANFLKRNTTREFQQVFNAILYDRSLFWGERIFALACLSKPLDSRLKLVAMKNRLGTNFVSILRWYRKLLASALNKKWHIIEPDLPS